MNNTYKFSIVTAVYNTAEYLEEMIDSVIQQDIDFEKNVQLILVDDGSDDDSVSICKKYQDKYPNNINVICLKHSGVSTARNEGIKLVKGKYVNFLDSDDKLENNALSEVEKFFKKHEDEIDLVAIPLYFFDKEQGEHILNYKFTNDRVIDISKEYNAIQLSSSSTFIKKNIIKKYQFNCNLKYAEDALIITKIILKEGKYGVLKSSKYYYRRRSRGDSTIQYGYKNSDWYIDYIINFSIYLINMYKEEKYNNYINEVVIYDLQWRIFPIKKIYIYLNRNQRREFINRLTYILKKVYLKNIYNQSSMSKKKKVVFLILKLLS